MTTTYKITGRTNEWIAQRDITFGGKTEIVIEEGLTLKEAQKKLIEFFCEDYEVYMSNWGLIRMNNPHTTWSNSDGTRGYEYDSRYYRIELEHPIYRVDDTETGNVVIYEGDDLPEAISTILADEEPDIWDLYKDGDRIWCGCINTDTQLKAFLK